MVPGFGVSAECQSIGTIGKKQRACYLAPKTLSCAYFELLFLGCGFLIHLSDRSDSPRFRAPWKKIRQKYRTQQEPSLFKGHTLSCQQEKHYVQWFLLKSVQDITVCEKNRFSLHESGWTKAWCPGLVPRPSAKAQEPVARTRGLVIFPPKLSVGAYFELSYLGCGFLIHLSNRSDTP